MTNNSITIWVYDDEGASELSVQSALATMQDKLSYSMLITIHTISSQDIINNKLSESKDIGVLVMPGGADLPYCQKLDGQGNDIIRDFIGAGNLYIGICAGGYYGARDIQFSGQRYENRRKKSYEINGPRELAFFSGTAIGSMATLTHGQLYDETVASKAMVTLNYANGEQDEVYYHGGAYFEADNKVNKGPDFNAVSNMDFNVLATYDDGKNAVITGDFGQGKYLLSGVHFELCADVYEEYAVKEASAADVERERDFLASMKYDDYGKLIYLEISKMIEEIYRSKKT